MIISIFDKGEKSESWNSIWDREQWSDEICANTHGAIQFRHGDDNEEVYLYILEFYMFLKAAIINTLGQSVAQQNLVLTLSGERICFERQNQNVRLSFPNRVIASMSWDQFTSDFLRLENELRGNFSEAFPLLSKSNEFALLFGLTELQEHNT